MATMLNTETRITCPTCDTLIAKRVNDEYVIKPRGRGYFIKFTSGHVECPSCHVEVELPEFFVNPDGEVWQLTSVQRTTVE